MIILMSYPPSRCSSGASVVFSWAPPRTSSDDIESAVDALLTAITTPGRRWNMWTRNAARSEFRKRLQAAQRGELVPVDHVKRLGRGSSVDMYEIRWQDITVHAVDQSGELYYPTILARLLHAEPPEFPDHFAGLYAHEKQIGATGAETEDLQNAAIDEAIKVFWRFEPTTWGITAEPAG
jgi:hypothetical protein